MTNTSPGGRNGPAGTQLRPAGRATRAATAGVDPALVIRHFGSKEALFLRSLDTSVGIGTVVEGPLETMGRRIVAYFLDPERPHVRRVHVALTQAAQHPQVRDELVRMTAETYVAPLAPRLSGEHRELRVALAVAQLGGLLTMLFEQEEPHLVDAERDDIVALYGDAMQRLLTPTMTP